MAEPSTEHGMPQYSESVEDEKEILGEDFSEETLKEDEDDLVKGFENLNANAEGAALPSSSLSSSASSVGLEKSLSSSKLNAQAPEFIPGRVPVQAQTAAAPLQVGPAFPSLVEHASTPPSSMPPPTSQFFEQQDVQLYETEGAGAGASTSSSKPVLTDELRQRIVKQVEFYFSDANLPTDKYLMKYLKKDPEGFVPIAVVASFRKIKNLVNNNHAWVGASLRTSSQLVVSEDGKKVRRLHPLHEIDIEEMQSRTVVAENLPTDYSIQNLEKLFGSVGNVKMVRVCHPHGYNDSGQVSSRPAKNEMLVSNRLHALVEYETVEQAEKAVAELNDEGNWRSGLRVQLLFKRMGKYGHQTKGRKSDKNDVHGEEDEADAGNDKQQKGSAQQSEQHDDFEGDGHHSNERNGGRRGRGRGRGKSRGRGQYHGNGRGHSLGTATSSNSTSSEVVVKQPPGPRMPDGTRGFTMGRGRPLSDSNV
uniref:HTH La-type RNA-binding domain-containing protein n=1 Tax=Araucaria cunninghamii TaxID=56994 RepID=A0A0D6QVC3_ARACU